MSIFKGGENLVARIGGSIPPKIGASLRGPNGNRRMIKKPGEVVLTEELSIDNNPIVLLPPGTKWNQSDFYAIFQQDTTLDDNGTFAHFFKYKTLWNIPKNNPWTKHPLRFRYNIPGGNQREGNIGISWIPSFSFNADFTKNPIELINDPSGCWFHHNHVLFLYRQADGKIENFEETQVTCDSGFIQPRLSVSENI